MKTLLHCLAVIILAVANPAHAVEQFLKATVAGSVQTQITLGAADGRIHTATLNTKRVFDEFAVSSTAYQLVYGSSSGLVLLPKLASSPLPTLTIMELGSSSIVIDTHARVFKLQAAITPGTANNLFKNLTGEVDGTTYYKGAYPPTNFSRLVLRVYARGTDPASSGAALLRFTITTGAVFVQQ